MIYFVSLQIFMVNYITLNWHEINKSITNKACTDKNKEQDPLYFKSRPFHLKNNNNKSRPF